MCRPLLMTVACLLVLFGISGLWVLPKEIQRKIEQRIQLKIGTKTYDRFTKIPIPLTVKFYLFNITNKEQVLAGLERPKFEEVGPFVYKQWRRREIVDFEDYNRRVKYREYKTFFPLFDFDKYAQQVNGQQQPGKLALVAADQRHNTSQNVIEANDMKQPKLFNELVLDPSKLNVTIINVPLLAILTKLAAIEDGSLKRHLVSQAASRLIADRQDKILITKPVNEILFDGFKVDVMESVKDLISGTFSLNFDSPLPNNKFGFFYLKNNTWSKRENGELTVFTGRNESMSDFMQIESWNGLKELSVWPKNTEAGNRCNQIKGTDGSQFHPGVKRSETLNIFSAQICTSINIKYKEDTEVRGIPLYRFSTPSDIFGAPKKHPKNACYCTIQPSSTISGQQAANGGAKPSLMSAEVAGGQQRGVGSTAITNSRCYLDGLLDLSLCQQGAPVAVSSPHFYNADPMLAMAAGLRPQRELHETHVDVEPLTGAVMRAASRVQLNAYVERAALEVVDSNLVGKMTPMVAPLMWLEEGAEIDEKNSAQLKRELFGLVNKLKRSCYFAILVGLVVILLVSGQFWYTTCRQVEAGPRQVAGRSTTLPGCQQQRRRRRQLEAARLRDEPLLEADRMGAASSGTATSDAKRATVKVKEEEEEEYEGE